MAWLNPRKKPIGSGSLASEEGQTTIEFALTLILLLAFVLFFLQFALVSAWGNYVHYATFMSARAYLAAGPDPSDQEDRARNVILKTTKRGLGRGGMDRYPLIARGYGAGNPRGAEIGKGAQFNPDDPALSWMEGVRYTFRSKLFLLPFGKPSDRSVNSLTLTSESWLGREPSYFECQGELGDKKGIFDNGC